VTSDVGTNHVQLCKPFPEHIQCHAQIVKELKQRDEHDKIQGRETAKRSLQSGEPNDTVDVELFSKKARLVGPFKKVSTREGEDFQWARAAVSAGLPMSFFDNEEVRKAVLMTAECAENYIRTQPGGVKSTTMPHHTFFTTKLIPKTKVSPTCL
jgi:hypothetical protein